FSFVDDLFSVTQLPADLKIDHAFECVGGEGSQVALQQLVEHISSAGSIALLGVSELPALVNTRSVLEKGLTLIGSSRCGSKDSEQVVDLYR
ncbi:zinc-binding dehydrogenase, partial [Staphylococcus aureus]